MFPENLWFALEQDLATLTQHCKEDGGQSQNSSEAKANTYFYLSQAPLLTPKGLARRLARHSWKLYSTLRMPLTGPLQNGRHSDLTSIFTWQSKHQKVPLQTWSLWPAAMWATRGMHKHSPSKQAAHKVHGNAQNTLICVPVNPLHQFPSNQSGKPSHYWRMTQKSELNQPDQGLLLYITH